MKHVLEKITEILEKRICDKIKMRESGEIVGDHLDYILDLGNEYMKIGKMCENEISSKNLAFLLHDIYIGGIETTSTMLDWIILYIFTEEDIEFKLRNEVKNVLGNEEPTIDDMKNCHYVMAFISEILRKHDIVNFGVPHRLLRKYEIGIHLVK